MTARDVATCCTVGGHRPPLQCGSRNPRHMQRSLWEEAATAFGCTSGAVARERLSSMRRGLCPRANLSQLDRQLPGTITEGVALDSELFEQGQKQIRRSFLAQLKLGVPSGFEIAGGTACEDDGHILVLVAVRVAHVASHIDQ